MIIMIPTDELIFFGGVGQPPTRSTIFIRFPFLFSKNKHAANLQNRSSLTGHTNGKLGCSISRHLEEIGGYFSIQLL